MNASTQRCTPQHAIVFLMYEEVKKIIQRQRSEENEEELVRIAIPKLISSSKYEFDANV